MNIDMIVDRISSMTEADGSLKLKGFGRCIFYIDDDIIRIFRPQVKVSFGGRILIGDIGFFLRSELPDIKNGPKNIEKPISLTVCSTMNMPDIIRASAISDGQISAEFVKLLIGYLGKMPNDLGDLEEMFGDFYLSNALSRVPRLANFLR